VVQPISATYQHLVALPTVLTNQVFDFAQDSVDYYLPEEADSEKDASLAQAEEAVPQPQEANNNVIKTKRYHICALARFNFPCLCLPTPS
jgi:hypothetical protein